MTGNQRAISIPLDSAAGLTPFLQAGDHVDILAGFNVIPIGANGAPLSGNSQARPVEKVIAQDIKVLEVPSSSSSTTGTGSNSGNIVVQVTDQQAWNIAFAINNGTVFLAGTPQAGNVSSKPSLVTLETHAARHPAGEGLPLARGPIDGDGGQDARSARSGGAARRGGLGAADGRRRRGCDDRRVRGRGGCAPAHQGRHDRRRLRPCQRDGDRHDRRRPAQAT